MKARFVGRAEMIGMVGPVAVEKRTVAPQLAMLWSVEKFKQEPCTGLPFVTKGAAAPAARKTSAS